MSYRWDVEFKDDFEIIRRIIIDLSEAEGVRIQTRYQIEKFIQHYEGQINSMLSQDEFNLFKNAWKKPSSWLKIKDRASFNKLKNFLDSITEKKEEKGDLQPEELEICPICRKIIREEPTVCQSCYSVFHWECIKRWFIEEQHKLCPFCEGDFGPIG
ncbi:MAG TPA: RING finger domain-containing protein [Candidatus Deferrimicrobium sp.]|nr:RING finger domain-containing protein [Candidatus Deferrimicrobium sp.]